MWDTEREREIHLGSQYPYEPLGRGECLVPQSYSDYGYVIGDTLRMTYPASSEWHWNFWVWITIQYYFEAI